MAAMSLRHLYALFVQIASSCCSSVKGQQRSENHKRATILLGSVCVMNSFGLY